MLLFRLTIVALLLSGTVNSIPGPAGQRADLIDAASTPEAASFIPAVSFQNDSAVPVYNSTGAPITPGKVAKVLVFTYLPVFMLSPWTWFMNGMPMKDSDQYCWYPHNPDIAGIGVRITFYVQPLVVVVLSLLSRLRQREPLDSLAGMHRVQVYTVIALVIAGLAQRAIGQLSIFHETIVVHLAFMSISSAWIGVPASAEELGERWLGPGLSEHPRLAYIFKAVKWHQSLGGVRLGIQFLVRYVVEFGPDWWGMLTVLPVNHALAQDFHQNVATCFPDAGEPWSSRGDLKWLASRILVLKWFLFVVQIFIASIIIFRITAPVHPKVFKEFKVRQRVTQLGVGLFFAIWIFEIFSIESSLKALPYFHGAEEDQWGFGQIFPLVLLLPLWEAIFDVLLSKAEETSSAATINRLHREACLLSDCDVQIVYDRETIRCGFHLTPYISHLISAAIPASVYVIVTDANVASLHLASLEQQLRTGSPNMRVISYTVPNGPAFKSRELVGQLEDFLLKNHCDAATVLIALGGGTVADLGGFVAATFMKGIPFVQIPTTLAAMVHSGLATHVTVNLGDLRDGSGVSYEPRYVFIDLAYLETLPPRQLCSGMTEIIQTRCIFWIHHSKRTSLMKFDETIVVSVGHQGRKVHTRSEQQTFFYSIIFEAISDRAALMRRARIDRPTVSRLFDVGHTVADSIQEILGPQLLWGELFAIGLIFEHRLLLLEKRITLQHFFRLKAYLRKWCLPVSLRDPRITNLITSKLLGPDKFLQAIGRNLRRRGFTDFEIVFLTPEEFVSSISPNDRAIKDLCLDRLRLSPASTPQQKVLGGVPTSRSELHYALTRAIVQDSSHHIPISGLISEETEGFIDALSALTQSTINTQPTSSPPALSVNTRKEASEKSLLAPTGTQVIEVRLTSSSLCYLLALCVLARLPTPRKCYIFTSRDPIKKTVSPLLEALKKNGSGIKYSETHAGGFTLEVEPARQRGGKFQLPANVSGTLVAALLVCAPRALTQVRLELVGAGPVTPQRWIDFTIKQMKDSGVIVTRQSHRTTGQILNVYTVPEGRYKRTVSVSDDVSLANCTFALAAITGSTVEMKRVMPDRPDQAFIVDVLRRFGCQVVQENTVLKKRTTVSGPPRGQLRHPGDLDMSHMPKSFLLAVVLSVVAWDPHRPRNSTRITGIKKQRGQDRLWIAIRELGKLGVDCNVITDGIEVYGKSINDLKRNVVVECNGDARVALAFSILGTVIPIVVDDKQCTERLYPSWWKDLGELFGLSVEGAANALPSTLANSDSSSIILTGKASVRLVGSIAAAALLWEFIDATPALENPLGTTAFENHLLGSPKKEIIYIGDDAVQAGTSAAKTLRTYTSGRGRLVHVLDVDSPQQLDPSSWLSGCTPGFKLFLSDISDSKKVALVPAAQEIRRFFKHVTKQSESIDLSPGHPTYVLDSSQLHNNPTYNVTADVIEFRVDLLQETPTSGTIPSLAYVAKQLFALRRQSPLPIIFSLRTVSHGGKHPDGEVDAAFALLSLAIYTACEYTAVGPVWPRDRLDQLVRDAHSSHTLIIASAHDPYGTLDWGSSDARDLYTMCAAFGDVVRISIEARTTESNFALRNFLSAIPAHGKPLPLAGMTTGPYGQLSCIFNTVLTPVGMPSSGCLSIPDIQRMRDFHDPQPVRSAQVFFLVQDGDASIQRTCLEAAFALRGLSQTCSVVPTGTKLQDLVQRPEFAGLCVDVPHEGSALAALVASKAPTVSQTRHADIALPMPGNQLHGSNALCLGLQAALLRRTIISTETRALVLGAEASVMCALCGAGVGRVYVVERPGHSQADAAQILVNFPVEWQQRVEVLRDLAQLSASVSLLVATSVAHVGVDVPVRLISGDGGCVVDLDAGAQLLRSAAAAGCSWSTVSAVDVLVERGIQLAELATGRSVARDAVLTRLREEHPSLENIL